MDIMGLAMKSMGINPQSLADMAQDALAQAGIDPAALLGRLARAVETIEGLDRRLADMQATIDALALHVGVPGIVPPPQALALILAESRAYVDTHGGLACLPTPVMTPLADGTSLNG